MRQDRKAPKTQGGARDQQALAPVARRGRADFASTDALAHAATALGKAGFSDVSIVMRWREIAGAQLAAIATPIKFAEGPEGATLTLRCEAGAALFLQHQTRALLERLNLYLGADRVARLRFVPGRITTTDDPPDHPARGAQTSDTPKSLGAALENLRARRMRLGTGRPR